MAFVWSTNALYQQLHRGLAADHFCESRGSANHLSLHHITKHALPPLSSSLSGQDAKNGCCSSPWPLCSQPVYSNFPSPLKIRVKERIAILWSTVSLGQVCIVLSLSNIQDSESEYKKKFWTVNRILHLFKFICEFPILMSLTSNYQFIVKSCNIMCLV